MINEILNILYKNKVINIKIIKNEIFYSTYIIIATGMSLKHIKSITKDFLSAIKIKKIISGENTEWLIISIEDITIHIMIKEIRLFYNLESLYLNNY